MQPTVPSVGVLSYCQPICLSKSIFQGLECNLSITSLTPRCPTLTSSEALVEVEFLRHLVRGAKLLDGLPERLGVRPAEVGRPHLARLREERAAEGHHQHQEGADAQHLDKTANVTYQEFV